MKMFKMVSLCELWFFMEIIRSYEPGILDLIKYHMKTYTCQRTHAAGDVTHGIFRDTYCCDHIIILFMRQYTKTANGSNIEKM